MNLFTDEFISLYYKNCLSATVFHRRPIW